MATAFFNLSTLNGRNGFLINGFQNTSALGTAVSGAGDVNGDGISDIIVGAPGSSPAGDTSDGAAFVIFGKRGGFRPRLDLLTLNGRNGFAIATGPNPIFSADRDLAGSAVGDIGDLNGDGLDDLIVGAPRADVPSSDPSGIDSVDAGQSFVVFGRRTGFGAVVTVDALNGRNGFIVNGASTVEASGSAVRRAGDVNGDGLDDVIIGAPAGRNAQGQLTGKSYVVFGRRGGFGATLNVTDLNGRNGFAITGDRLQERAGFSVAGIRDINGDGVEDLAIGAPGEFRNVATLRGRVYILFGRRGGFGANVNVSDLNGRNGFVITGSKRLDRFGFSVASAGDVNGDGLPDLLVGARGVSDAQGRTNRGSSYVIFGRRGGFGATLNLATLNGRNGFELQGVQGGNFLGSPTDSVGGRLGESVSHASDVNGDGIDDLIIGSPGIRVNRKTAAGAVYVLFGRRSGFRPKINAAQLDSRDGIVINGDQEFGNFGSAVSSSDVNHDGLNDLIIGAPGVSLSGLLSGEGRAYVIFGSRRWGTPRGGRTGVPGNPVGDRPFNSGDRIPHDPLLGIPHRNGLIGGDRPDPLLQAQGQDLWAGFPESDDWGWPSNNSRWPSVGIHLLTELAPVQGNLGGNVGGDRSAIAAMGSQASASLHHPPYPSRIDLIGGQNYPS